MDLDLTPVDAATAAAELYNPRFPDREFFGRNVFRHGPAVLAGQLRREGVHGLRASLGEETLGLAGFAWNPVNQRQVTVSVCPFAAERGVPMLTGLLGLLRSAARVHSAVAWLPADQEAIKTYEVCGFDAVGRLERRRFRAGQYIDEVVMHRDLRGAGDAA